MARFFKFIFRVLLIVYIAIVLALIVPPLVGYTTATVLESTEGNQTVGTVDYAKRIPLQELKVGEKILVTGTDSVNVYTVQSVNVDAATVTVADTENQEIPVRSYVYKMVLAVPLIGYVIIALETTEGVIFLAAVAVLLILLCVLTGIWSRKTKEKKQRRKEREAERVASEKRAAERAAMEEQSLRSTAENGQVLNARAEAYFAARRAEERQKQSFEEYEEFPPRTAGNPAKKESVNAMQMAAEMDYFDDEEDNENADSWLHDDVDDEDLFAGLNNKAATESLMATARLFAINRAAQLKEQMAVEEKAEEINKTQIVTPETLAAVKAREAAAAVKTERQHEHSAVASGVKEAGPENDVRPAETGTVVKGKTPVKEIAVDKIINLKELKELDEDTQQIVLTINIKVVSE